MRSSSFDPESMRRADAPEGLFLDADGRWFHDGDGVRHERLCALLNRSIARNESGELIVTTGRDVLPFIAERTPLLISTVRESAGRPVVVLSDQSEEAIEETKVVADESGAFFAVVKEGRFWARCARPAVQWLMGRLAADNAGGYRLDLERTVPITVVDIEKIDLSAPPPAELVRSS